MTAASKIGFHIKPALIARDSWPFMSDSSKMYTDFLGFQYFPLSKIITIQSVLSLWKNIFQSYKLSLPRVRYNMIMQIILYLLLRYYVIYQRGYILEASGFWKILFLNITRLIILRLIHLKN